MKTITLTFSLALILILSLPVFADQTEKDNQKAVLVTGASSGIGLRITEVLAENGYLVYAGARKEVDLKRLNQMNNVEAVRLDVTVQEDIDAAVKFVTERGRGLYGLVNNAGVAVMGPLIEVDVKEVQWEFDVNVFGPFRVTQAFAPLIIKSQGRITTTGSISGIVSRSMYGMYSMSKHAVEAFSDSLALEMQRFGVKVSIVEPGGYASNIGKSATRRIMKNNYWTTDTAYKEEQQALLARGSNLAQGKDPREVAEAVLHAMSADKPKHRYMVTPNAEQAHYTVSTAMTEMLQLNQNQPYELNREQLIQMLDQGLKAQ